MPNSSHPKGIIAVIFGLYYDLTEHLLILVSVVTGCVSISDFASLVSIPMKSLNFSVGVEIFAKSSWIKKYKSMIKKKKKYDKIVFLAKTKLNNIEVLICKSIINWYISHNEFVAANDVLREYNDMRKEIKNKKA